MGYTYDIQYCSTNNFGQADGLSRLPIGPDKDFDKQDPGETSLVALIQKELQQDLPLRASQIAKATQKDSILLQVYNFILSGWPLTITDNFQAYYRIRDELSTSNGCITWGLRTIIPNCFRNSLLNYLHSSHPGMTRMKVHARRYFWWPSMDKEIEDIVRKCSSCTENSKQPTKAPLSPWPVPDQPWKRIHMDFMGKFMGLYFLIIVDAFSKWIEVVTMHNPSTKATIDALSSLFARYGLCEIIVSDNGSQFTSTEFNEFCARNGIKHITTSPGHPQSNGQAERYVDTVKSALKKGLQNGGNISDVLLNFLFHYRTTPHATTNATPAELLLKRQLRTVLDLLRPNTFDPSHAARCRYQRNFDQHTKARYFQANNTVLVRDFRNSSNKIQWTPGVLINRQGARLWTVKVGNHIWRRHENQIKHREWSTDEDVISMDPTATTTDHNRCSSTSSSTDQGSPILRRSGRVKKTVKRLIEEI
jgi:transposase InsO family protein